MVLANTDLLQLLARGSRLVELLKQPQYQPQSFEVMAPTISAYVCAVVCIRLMS